LGFSATFAGGTLSMNFNLGTSVPATFDIALLSGGVPTAQPFSRAIPAVVPPQAFSMHWNSFPDIGTITVSPKLDSAPGQGLCAEWATVDTSQ
jgi:hypothetical protein